MTKSGPRGIYSRGYLPHHDHPRFTQFITFRLADSMPAHVLKEWERELKFLPKDDREREEYRRAEQWLDQGRGECLLARPEVGTLVAETLAHFHGEHYELLAWVVMPNHVHVLAKMGEEAPIGDVVGSWKKRIAREANKILGRRGPFWYREYYDRWMRNEEHRLRTIQYIHRNPVKAGLCRTPEEWPLSSAAPGTAGLQTGGHLVREHQSAYLPEPEGQETTDSAGLETSGPTEWP